MAGPASIVDDAQQRGRSSGFAGTDDNRRSAAEIASLVFGEVDR